MSLRNYLFVGSTAAVSLAALVVACKGSSANGPTPSIQASSGSSGSSGGVGASGGGVLDATAPVPPHTFVELFSWSGTHAAVVNSGQGTAVGWNSDNWDVTGDTQAIGIMAEWTDTPTPNALAQDGTPMAGLTNTNSGHSVYVHKAASPCDSTSTAVCDGTINDTALIPGGDGSQGIGVMHMDEQDIVGARLRNPMLISEATPGVVQLRAPRFVTMGHWWEIALTPTDKVIGAESTVVESQGLQDGLGDPDGPPNSPGKGAGPGHDPQEASFIVVVTGATDFACETQAAEEGSLTRIAIKSIYTTPPAGLAGGYQTATGYRYNFFNPHDFNDGVFYGTYQKNFIRPGLDGRNKLPQSFLNADGSENTAKVAAANLADQLNLYLWQFEFRPSGVDVRADFNDGQGLALVEHFDTGVAWSEAYVNVIGAVYQDDHHPQVEPCYVPNPYTKRDMRFRTIQVNPVKYTATSVFPPDGAPTDTNGNVLLCNSASCGRWMNYDMRDTHNWGAPDVVTVGGKSVTLKKANSKVFTFGINYAHASTDEWTNDPTQPGFAPEKSFDLYVPVNADMNAATAANFVYNVMGAKGVANLLVNGQAAGTLLTADSVVGAWVKNDIATDTGCPNYDCMSVRRSVSIDPKMLLQGAQNGLAHIQVVFDQANLGTGTFIDRIQLELMH